MRAIPAELSGFDFNWSSSCFEHLGTLDAGIDFVIAAVENTLRSGGIAVHTTEYNLTSNEHTVTEGPTVIYRRRDIDELVRRLRDRGHIVTEFTVAPLRTTGTFTSTPRRTPARSTSSCSSSSTSRPRPESSCSVPDRNQPHRQRASRPGGLDRVNWPQGSTTRRAPVAEQ